MILHWEALSDNEQNDDKDKDCNNSELVILWSPGFIVHATTFAYSRRSAAP